MKNILNNDQIWNLRVQIKTICHSWFGERININDEEIEWVIELIETLPNYDWNLVNLILNVAHWKIELPSKKIIENTESKVKVERVKEQVANLMLSWNWWKKHTYMWTI